MQDEVLATIRASSPRRWAGVGMLAAVGALVTYVALVSPPEPVWQVFLFAVGGASLWLALSVWRATEDYIELTPTELRTGSGQVIAETADIEVVDRGVFAFKPSNGFLVRTRHKAANRWAPGLWWRVGYRIGVGGMTSAAEAKFMSEVLSSIIADERGHC
ncbi:hypothetical protein [uncultured Ruegeria sp.]|uniref:hypothetical protein n=1 Tax=uncultured Ruegeria sp. TaxID=259304 RepID=UPI002632C376|nr:hypothetical protein [uncultured Ruegeria sp.]